MNNVKALKLHYNYYITFFLYGLTAITAQILLFRELFTKFGGNELVAGIVLSMWLLFTGIGSFIVPKYLHVKPMKIRQLSYIQIIVVLIAIFSFFFIQLLLSTFQITQGETIGLIPILCITAIILAPICILLGWFYSQACHITCGSIGSIEKSIQTVYWSEAFGACLGGLVLSLVFLKFTPPLYIVLSLLSVHIFWTLFQSKIKKWLLSIIISLLLLSLYFGMPLIQNQYDRFIWKDQELIRIKDSPYGRLTATRLGEQIQFYQNGIFLFSHPDPYSAEQKAHIPLLTHPSPKNILLLGNGFDGTIQEILKYREIETLDYVELNSYLVGFIQKIMKENHNAPLINDKLNVYHTDARLWLQKSKQEYDVIIMHFPSPATLQWNRYYTKTFFNLINDHLKTNGLFAFTVESSENAISPELNEYLSTIYHTLQHVFENLILLPGETGWFMCSQSEETLNFDSQLLLDRIHNRRIETLYVREYYLPYQYSKERLNWIDSQLQKSRIKSENKDLHPKAFYFSIKLWASYFAHPFKKLFKWTAQYPIFIFSLLIILQFIIPYFSILKTNDYENHKTHILLYLLMIVGWTEISILFILTLGLQLFIGQIYLHISLLIASYMAGLVVGSKKNTKGLIQNGKSYLRIRNLQITICLFPIMMIGFFYLKTWINLMPLFTQISIFCILALIAGYIGGIQFIVINQVYLRTNKSINAGKLYALDLFGSSFGAIITTIFCIPIIGIIWTLLFLGVMNLGGIILLIISWPKKNDMIKTYT